MECDCRYDNTSQGTSVFSYILSNIIQLFAGCLLQWPDSLLSTRVYLRRSAGNLPTWPKQNSLDWKDRGQKASERYTLPRRGILLSRWFHVLSDGEWSVGLLSFAQCKNYHRLQRDYVTIWKRNVAKSECSKNNHYKSWKNKGELKHIGIFRSKWGWANENTMFTANEDVHVALWWVIFIISIDWYFQAVCCSDHIHCCPNGYTCDPAQGTCESSLGLMPLFDKKPAKKSVPNWACPDKQVCQNNMTCCKTENGSYDCCPLPDVRLKIYYSKNLAIVVFAGNN